MATDQPKDRLSELAEAVKLRKLAPPRAEPPKPRPPPPQVVEVYQARRVQTIEQTGKKWKVRMLLGSLLMVVSGIGACGVMMDSSMPAGQADTALVVAALAFGVGLTIYLLGRFGGWWFHG